MVAAITNKAKHFLSLKIVTWLILVSAIGSKIIQVVFLFNLHSDRAQQMLATYYFVSGYGITSAWVFPDDLSQIIYEPVIKWPPGYSLLLAPFYILFNHNYIAAGLILDIVTAVVLIFTSRAILRILNVPVYLINAFTLLTGFYIYSFHIITSSDAIAISFFIIALYFTLLLLKNSQHRIKYDIYIITSLFACATIKYMFIPVVFIIPIFLIIKGFADTNSRLIKKGAFSFLVLAFSLTVLLVYQKYISGSAIHIQSTGRGFFINNLLTTYPFIPASLIKPDTIGLIFPQPPWVEPLVFRIFQIIHLLSIFFLLSWVIFTIVKNRFRKISLAESFFYLVIFVSLTISIELMILSVNISKERGLWTYVEEPRYFGLPSLLIHLSIFVFYKHFRSNISGITKYIIYFLFLLLSMEFFRGVLFGIKRIKNFGKEQYSWQVEYEIQKYADSIIRMELQKHPNENIIIAGPSSYMNYRISLYSHIPILKDVYKINDLTTLKTKKDVLLLIILREDALKDFQPFISMKEKIIAGQFNIFSFYTLHVSPH